MYELKQGQNGPLESGNSDTSGERDLIEKKVDFGILDSTVWCCFSFFMISAIH